MDLLQNCLRKLNMFNNENESELLLMYKFINENELY